MCLGITRLVSVQYLSLSSVLPRSIHASRSDLLARPQASSLTDVCPWGCILKSPAGRGEYGADGGHRRENRRARALVAPF